MRPLISAAGVAAALVLSASRVAEAAHEQAGVTLEHGEAAGPWTWRVAGQMMPRSAC